MCEGTLFSQNYLPCLNQCVKEHYFNVTVRPSPSNLY